MTSITRIDVIPRSSVTKPPNRSKSSLVAVEMWMRRACPVDSILEAVLTVSPKRQYLGIFKPTTPATHGPKKNIFFS